MRPPYPGFNTSIHQYLLKHLISLPVICLVRDENKSPWRSTSFELFIRHTCSFLFVISNAPLIWRIGIHIYSYLTYVFFFLIIPSFCVEVLFSGLCHHSFKWPGAISEELAVTNTFTSERKLKYYSMVGRSNVYFIGVLPHRVIVQPTSSVPLWT